MTLNSIDCSVSQYLRADAQIEWHQAIPNCKIPNWTVGMQANASFFGDPEFGEKYFKSEHSSQAFGNRWRTAIGDWNAKIVVDIGCGPGNLYAAVGGSPRTIFGVDISHGALVHATLNV